MKTGNEAKKSIFDFNEFSHGFDYLTFGVKNKENIASFFTQRIYDLDLDNSNYGAITIGDEIFGIQKYSSPTGTSYSFSCTYETLPVNCFVVNIFSSSHSELCGGQYGVVHFYGNYFRLVCLDWFSRNTIDSLMGPFQNLPITRCDYRFDFAHLTKVVPLPTPEEVFPRLRKNKKQRRYIKSGRLQSWDLGNKINKTIFIRLYNKLDELEGNLKKTYLYGDFSKFKTYHRLEYEFGIKFCKGTLGKDIDDLIQRIYKYTQLEPSTFTGNFYKPQRCLDLSDKIDRLRYIKMFKSMGVNIYKNGLDPINLLTKEIKRLGL